MTTTTTCPSFIDLRAFAAQGAAPTTDPFGAGRRIVSLRGGPVEVGAIDLGAGSGSAPAPEGDLWLFAANGAVTLSCAAGEITLAGNASCMLGSGTAFAWRAEAPATLIFMRYTPAAPGAPSLTPIDLAAELAPSNPPLAHMLVGETPSCRNHADFRSADGEFSAGVWDSTPYYRKPQRYVHFELMVLLKGSVTFVDETGREGTFRQGDVFLAEQGATCSWDSREDVAKVWVIYRPLA